MNTAPTSPTPAPTEPVPAPSAVPAADPARPDMNALPDPTRPLPVVSLQEFPREEFWHIMLALKRFPSIYNKFWGMSRPHYSKSIPTAAVYFNKEGQNIGFAINPDFWAKQTLVQKEFIICHEIAHVMFLHGYRAKALMMAKENPQLINIAMDLVVNQFVTDSLRFIRKNIDPPQPDYPKGVYVWLDTIFDPEDMVSPNRSFEYYWDKCKSVADKLKGRGMLVDSHEYMLSFDDPGFGQEMQDNMNPGDLREFYGDPAAKKSNQGGAEEMARKQNEFTQREAPLDDPNAKSRGKQAGQGGGRQWMQMVLEKTPPKRKWESIIKNWAARNINYKDKEQWRKQNRNYHLLPKDLMMPCIDESDDIVKQKIRVWFFQDTSGSCVDLATRFFKAAKSLPPDRFDVKMHCFDTSVYKTDLKSGKLYGFGGTSFSCIEEFIQKEIGQPGAETSYPQAVFVITDGMGDNVTPEHPSKWFWFLSEDYKSCIPAESKTYMLADFE